jgi:hypothetical protein
MNLGQLLGEQKLRIMQLEDEIEQRGCPLPPAVLQVPVVPSFVMPAEPTRSHTAPTPVNNKGYDRGIGQRIYACIPDHPPGKLLSEIVEELCDVPGRNVSSFLCQFKDIKHTGAWRRYRYFRKAAA